MWDPRFSVFNVFQVVWMCTQVWELYLRQWFSNLNKYQNLLEGLLKTECWDPFPESWIDLPRFMCVILGAETSNCTYDKTLRHQESRTKMGKEISSSTILKKIQTKGRMKQWDSFVLTAYVFFHLPEIKDTLLIKVRLLRSKSIDILI